MNVIANTIRGFLNITASGVMLLIGVVVFTTATKPPYGRWALKDGDLVTILVCASLAVMGAYLALKFWKHRPGHSSSIACAFMTATASLLLFSSLGFYFIFG